MKRIKHIQKLGILAALFIIGYGTTAFAFDRLDLGYYGLRNYSFGWYSSDFWNLFLFGF